MIILVGPAVAKSWLFGSDIRFAIKMRRLWARSTMWVLGVRIERSGQLPPKSGCLIVGNHRSYLDPVVVMQDVEVLPVAKAEVESWPVIGYSVRATGVIYVKRDDKDSRAATMDAMQQALRDGYQVLVYPEGTTHKQPVTTRLNPGAFRLAAAMGVPVVPVAIEYSNENDAWVGDETFIPHFKRTFGRKTTFLKIRYGNPIHSDSSAVLLSETKKWLDENMALLRSEFEAEKTPHGQTAYQTAER